MTARVLHGDCLDVMPTLDAESVDAVICDPPYGLSFMGKAWDHGVPAVPFWEAALRVAKPGAYLLAFGGTRTYHRLTCAIEDAGWEIHDGICTWLYGSGFPKHRSKLKPAWEPIIVAWKPAKKATPLNIDACRIPSEPFTFSRGATALGRMNDDGWKPKEQSGENHPAGRWPANVVLDEQSGADLDEQSGFLRAGGDLNGSEPSRPAKNTYAGGLNEPRVWQSHGDSGGASRFFYCAKASRTERDAGLTGERKPLNWSAGTKNPGSFQSEGTDKTARNYHPTVKPLDLMRWLCRLVTPRDGLILNPFCGSGSTGCAAALEGFRFIGIEREAEFATIARARIAHHATLHAPTLGLEVA